MIIDAGGELRNVQLQPVAAVAAGSVCSDAGVIDSAGAQGGTPGRVQLSAVAVDHQ